jgi:LPPG:FO 2-phospho-L-lactate transferase
MKIVVLTGGVGGAKLVDGLVRVARPDEIVCVVNTGDDFVHWGLNVSPDLDTVTYTLAGRIHPEQGWGLAAETFRTLDAMRRLGGDGWFRLGDEDLATHIFRTQALAAGERLTHVTARLCAAFGVAVPVLPMSDAPRPTMIDTIDGRTLPFQRWYVGERAAPPVRAVRYEGQAAPTAEVLAAISSAELVCLAPSNPYLSLDPILTLPGVRETLEGKRIVAVSPIVGGRAVSGPLASLMETMHEGPASAEAVIRHYRGLVTHAVVQRGDVVDVPAVRVLGTDTILATTADRARLAEEIVAFVEQDA